MQYEADAFKGAPSAGTHEITYLPHRLDPVTARLAQGHDAVCIFVNDSADAETLDVLKQVGVKAIALRVRGDFVPFVAQLTSEFDSAQDSIMCVRIKSLLSTEYELYYFRRLR